MKTIVALAVAALLVPHSAYALRITHGSVLLPNEIHAEANFGGNNFSVFATEEPFTGLAETAFGINPLQWVMQFGTFGTIEVGNEECIPIEATTYCGQVTLTTSRGFMMPDDWSPTTLFVNKVPFTATGYLLVGGNRYAITAEGTVTGMRCLQPSDCGISVYGNPPFERALLAYTFTVDEPPTRLLTLAFALTMVGLASAHRRLAVMG
jgi:hypothetical protein